MRGRRIADVRELVHERVVDLQPAGGIDDDRVLALAACLLEARARGRDGVLALRAGDRDLQLAAQLLELRHRGRTL